MSVVLVNRYDPDKQLYRLLRVVGTVGTVGDGQGYSYKISLGVRPCFPFVHLSVRRAYGGIYV